MRVYNIIDINFNLINAAKSKCENLDLNTTTAFKRFLLEEKYIKVINFLKKQIYLY